MSWTFLLKVWPLFKCSSMAAFGCSLRACLAPMRGASGGTHLCRTPRRKPVGQDVPRQHVSRYRNNDSALPSPTSAGWSPDSPPVWTAARTALGIRVRERANSAPFPLHDKSRPIIWRMPSLLSPHLQLCFSQRRSWRLALCKDSAIKPLHKLAGCFIVHFP